MVLARRFPAAEFDRALVLRARAGDQDAFEQLMHEYGGVVRRLVYRFVRDTDDARDVEQDTWIRAATHLDDLRDEGRFRPWLKSIARHSALNFIAARKTQRARVSNFEACGTEDFEDTSDPSPENHALSRDNQRKVWEALGALSERDRQALFMREYQDLPYTQIAERLGIARNAAEVCVFRARERFRRLFDEVDARVQDCGLDPLRLSALIDAEVDCESAQALRDHVSACTDCEQRLLTMQAGQALYRNLGAFGFPIPGLLESGLLGSSGVMGSLAALWGKVAALLGGGSATASATGAATAATATTTTATVGTATAGATVVAGTAAGGTVTAGGFAAIPAVASAIAVAVSSAVAAGAIATHTPAQPAAPVTAAAQEQPLEQGDGHLVSIADTPATPAGTPPGPSAGSAQVTRHAPLTGPREDAPIEAVEAPPAPPAPPSPSTAPAAAPAVSGTPAATPVGAAAPAVTPPSATPSATPTPAAPPPPAGPGGEGSMASEDEASGPPPTPPAEESEESDEGSPPPHAAVHAKANGAGGPPAHTAAAAKGKGAGGPPPPAATTGAGGGASTLLVASSGASGGNGSTGGSGNAGGPPAPAAAAAKGSGGAPPAHAGAAGKGHGAGQSAHEATSSSATTLVASTTPAPSAQASGNPGKAAAGPPPHAGGPKKDSGPEAEDTPGKSAKGKDGGGPPPHAGGGKKGGGKNNA